MKICEHHTGVLRRELWVAGLPPFEVGNFSADNPLVKAQSQIIQNALTFWPDMVHAPGEACPLCLKPLDTLGWPSQAAQQLKETK